MIEECDGTLVHFQLTRVTAMLHSDRLFAELHAMGAGEFEHMNGTLAAHLRDTESLLRAWGAREAVCIAGLCHAVYGTDGYNPALTGLDGRQRIAQLIGAEAEELVYLYGACNRRLFYPRIGTDARLIFVDRFSNTEYSITHRQLSDLCELILANELEIAAGSAEFRAKYGPSLSGLFERMAGIVSETGFAAYRSILSQHRSMHTLL